MTTGEKMKQARIAKGLTQEDLSERLGYKSKTSVSHLERGRNIPWSLIMQLADILDIAPAYLMGWEEKEVAIMIQLKELREETPLNMRQTAAALKMPYTTYVSYEKGEREPNLEMLITLTNYFNCSIDYLVGRSSERVSEGSISMENIPLRGCDGAKIEQVIVTRALKGSGTESDPYREVTQYWTLDGEFLFEKVT